MPGAKKFTALRPSKPLKLTSPKTKQLNIQRSKAEYSHLSHLDDEQFDAVTSQIGPILVHAGPGAGKTRVIVERIAFLIDHYNIDPSTILALS